MKSLITNEIYSWERGKLIGRGAFGEVYEYNTPHGKVAIKVNNRYGYGFSNIGTYIREASMLMVLRNSPFPFPCNFPEGNCKEKAEANWNKKKNYTIPLLDVVMVNGDIGLVFPLAIADLNNYLKTHRLSLVEKKRMMYQLALGMKFIQSKNIYHGDYKSPNILVFASSPLVNGEDGREKNYVFADFGTSSIPTPFSSPFVNGVENGVEDNHFTLWWKAPELILGGKYTFAADIWALGIIYYQILNGDIPVKKEWEMQQLMGYAELWGKPNKELTSFPKYYPNMFIGIKGKRKIFSKSEKILSKMLVMNPNERGNIDDVINDSYFDSVRNLDSALISMLACENPDKSFFFSHLDEKREKLDPPYPGWEKHHALIVEWIDEVCKETRTQEIMHRVIAIYEASRRKIKHTANTIQLLMMASYYLAISLMLNTEDTDKYLDSLLYLSDYAYTREQILTTVYQIAGSLSFDLLFPTSKDILEFYLKMYPESIHKTARKLLELSYLSTASMLFSKHSIALCSIALPCNLEKINFLHLDKLMIPEKFRSVVKEGVNILGEEKAKKFGEL